MFADIHKLCIIWDEFCEFILIHFTDCLFWFMIWRRIPIFLRTITRIKRALDMSKKIRWGILSTAKIGTVQVIPAMQQGEWCYRHRASQPGAGKSSRGGTRDSTRLWILWWTASKPRHWCCLQSTSQPFTYSLVNQIHSGRQACSLRKTDRTFIHRRSATRRMRLKLRLNRREDDWHQPTPPNFEAGQAINVARAQWGFPRILPCRLSCFWQHLDPVSQLWLYSVILPHAPRGNGVVVFNKEI